MVYYNDMFLNVISKCKYSKEYHIWKYIKIDTTKVVITIFEKHLLKFFNIKC